MKDHIHPNRHITSMVHLRRYVQMLSSEMNLGKHIQRIKRILNAPPNVDAYHKSSLPLSCSQTSRFPQRQTYLQVLCEDSKVVPVHVCQVRPYHPRLLGVRGEALHDYLERSAFLFPCYWRLGAPGADSSNAWGARCLLRIITCDTKEAEAGLDWGRNCTAARTQHT